MQRRSPFNELVPSFLKLKQQVFDYCDGDPSVLYEDAKIDQKLRALCVELYHVAKALRGYEEAAENGLIAPVNEKFSKEWNDYRASWRKPIGDVWTFHDWPEMADNIVGLKVGPSVYVSGTEDEILKMDAFHFKDLITELKSAQLCLDEDTDEHQSIESLVVTLSALWKTAGFSLQAAFERADEAPVALIPPGVASKVTPDGRLSLYRFWNEARKAYISGAPMASIAMARATLEVLLKDVHKAKGESLEEKIQYMEKGDRLPGSAMTRIRKAGNTILHALEDPLSIPAKKASENPSQGALQVLRDLKAVIEAT